MDKNQTYSGAPASVLATRNRRLLLARYFLLAVFLTLSVLSLQPKTTAHAAERALRTAGVASLSHQPKAARYCPTCRQAYIECLASGGGASCVDQYNLCIENCH